MKVELTTKDVEAAVVSHVRSLFPGVTVDTIKFVRAKGQPGVRAEVTISTAAAITDAERDQILSDQLLTFGNSSTP